VVIEKNKACFNRFQIGEEGAKQDVYCKVYCKVDIALRAFAEMEQK
jgi:hypothetical protein